MSSRPSATGCVHLTLQYEDCLSLHAMQRPSLLLRLCIKMFWRMLLQSYTVGTVMTHLRPVASGVWLEMVAR